MAAWSFCKSCSALASVLLALLLPGPPAWSDEATTPQPLQPEPIWPSLNSLLKLPGWMSLELDLTAEPMGGFNPALNAAGSAAWMQQLALTAELSSGFNKPEQSWQELDHWKLALQLTNFSGDPNLNLALGTTFPLQTASHPVGLWLTEASLQRSSPSDALKFKGGLLSLNPSFIENDTLDGYIHSALNNTLNLLIPGLPINPFVAPGAELHWKTSPQSELRLGSYWLDSETALAKVFGVNPLQPDISGTLQVVQWSTGRLPGSAAMDAAITSPSGPIARQLPDPLLQLGAFSTTAATNLAPAGSNQGIYGTLTLPVPLPVGLDNRVWIAASKGFQSQSNPFPLFVAGGWLNQGLVPGRPLDVLALGFGRTSFSPQLAPGSDEAVVELNYAIKLNAQLTLQPVIQWIANPGGNSNGSSAYAGGVQLMLSL